MAKKIENWGDRREFIVMVRFMNKHKAVIQQAARESGRKDHSDWIRRIVFDKVRHLLDESGDPKEQP